MSDAKYKVFLSERTTDTDCAPSLRSLFVTLSPYELREFRRWIDQVDFRCDLLGKVPLEIAHQILGYLPLHQCFRIRRVSKDWFRMLSAPQTGEHLLRFWYPEAEAKLEVPKGLTAGAVSSSRAEHVDAYRAGSAFSMMKGYWNITYRGSTATNVAYANGYVAWISNRNSHNLYCFHLESGSREKWSPPDAEAFSHIAMSSSVVVATTNAGICYVFTHTNNEKHKFPLASTFVERITASGDTVAILYNRSPKDNMQVEVTIWTLKSERSVQCHARLQELPFGQAPQHDIKMMIGTNTDYLVLFERCFNPRGFYFTRFSFDGRIHSRGYLEGPDTATFSRYSDWSIPSDVGGYATIWSYCHRHEIEDPGSRYAELIRVQYDPQQNQLQLKTNRIIGWPWPMNPSGLFFWKDVVYYREGFIITKLLIFDLSNNGIDFAATMGTDDDSRFDESPDLTGRNDERQILLESCFFGDENFLVNVCDSGFLAWCFNKDTKMKMEDEGYAQHRQGEMQKRLRDRRVQDASAIAGVLRREEIDLEITGSVGNYRAFQENQNQLSMVTVRWH